MGRRNRSAVTVMWAATLGPGRALMLAYTIADRVPDGTDEWWDGHAEAAVHLGLKGPADPFTPTAQQAVKRAVRQLREAGFLEVITPGKPGRRTVYRVHFKEPSVWPTGGL